MLVKFYGSKTEGGDQSRDTTCSFYWHLYCTQLCLMVAAVVTVYFQITLLDLIHGDTLLMLAVQLCMYLATQISVVNAYPCCNYVSLSMYSVLAPVQLCV